MTVQPMFVSVGTSYWGNAYRGFGRIHEAPSARYYSIGAFLRPSSRIHAPAETVLFCETVAWDEIIRIPDGTTSQFRLRGAAGWHGGGRFNLAFADGHASDVRMRNDWSAAGASAPMDDPMKRLEIRGMGFRFDCRPDALIEDKPVDGLAQASSTRFNSR